MAQLLPYFIILPFLAFLTGLLVPRKKEASLFRIVILAVGVQLAGMLAFTGYWWWHDAPALEIKWIELYRSPGFVFFIDFYFDRITAVFALTGVVLTFLVAVFSRYYMHRDEGFKRFFGLLLLFFAGYNLIVFSGNFETLFVGWETIGITSFMLIAFYRDRYLPVKNGFKVLSFYRLGDICLILAMWMSHHLWHRNITFSEWGQVASLQELYREHYVLVLFIALMIVLAAAIKSAQLPFSTWLPRAMEGPTTSSAIFYGSLSVHIGAFLLLRTYPFWEHVPVAQWLVIGIGLVTSLVATAIARVQSTVKTQIAYASIAQIGLIFIEIALGFHLLAMIHFAGNAFLRTYQLLVSPSVLSYRIHDMFFHFHPRKVIAGNAFFNRIQKAVYILSIREWNLDFLLHRFLWQPFKRAGHRLVFIYSRWGMAFGLLFLAAGIAGFTYKEHIGFDTYRYLPLVFSASALMLILKGFTGRGDASRTWVLTFFSQFFIALSILWNKHMEWYQLGYYLSGAVVSAIVGYICLRKLKAAEGNIGLDHYHGHIYEHRGIAMVFLLSCLGLAGFPITPTFIGIDLLFTHIHEDQWLLVLLTGLNFLFLELTLLRVYIRIFLGQHKKAYHPVAFRSS